MTRRTLRFLAVTIALLVAALVVLERGGDGTLPGAGDRLFPELRERLNDVTAITIERYGEDAIEISRSDDGWRVSSRDGYAADLEKIRNVLIAVADAAVVEAKTANPELHGRLGLDAPEVEDGKGVRIRIAAGDESWDVIVGNRAQGSYRYARRGDEEQTWLVDQDPDIPDAVGEWLDRNLVDIDSTAIRAVTITQPDGETLSISKADETATDFDVADVPEGRELSYSTVANGIGGALNGLELDDVRRGTAGDDAVVAVFSGFNGLEVTVRTVTEDDVSWISLAASGGEEGQADEINRRMSGWQFQVANYKANLLKRRLEDVLKPEESE